MLKGTEEQAIVGRHKTAEGDQEQVMSAQDEKTITEILTNPKLRALKGMLEKDHAIDCLFLLHMDKGRWKQAKEFMNRNHLTLSDGTFRSRMIEIEHNGFATSTQLDPLKKHYHITEKGKKLTAQLLKLLHQQL